MKITKRQLKRIIKEEYKKIGRYDFGSNSERQRNLDEGGNIDGGPLEGLANASVSQIENMMDRWEQSVPGNVSDPRADDVYDLLFQLRERLMAILENRE